MHGTGLYRFLICVERTTRIELSLVATAKTSKPASAQKRLLRRIAEERQDAAQLFRLAIDPAGDPLFGQLLLERAVERFRRVKSLEKALGVY